MLKFEKKKYILEYLKENRNVSRKQLAEDLGVTLMSVGRYLKELEKEGELECTYGGAIIKNNLNIDTRYRYKKNENIEIKSKIAKEAYTEIKSGMTIMLDAGTTNFELAKLIKKSNLRNLTIITTDLYSALELYENSNIKVNLIGGEVSNKTGSTGSVISLEQIKEYNADLLFLGTSAISKEFIVTSPSEMKAKLKQEMLKNSKRRILLVDKSKFEKRKLYNAFSIKDIELIITDYDLKEKVKGLEEIRNKIKIIRMEG